MAFEFIKKLFGGGVSKAAQAFEQAKDAVADKMDDINLSDITSSVSEKFGDMKDAVADKIGDVKDAVSEKVGDLHLDNIASSIDC